MIPQNQPITGVLPSLAVTSAVLWVLLIIIAFIFLLCLTVYMKFFGLFMQALTANARVSFFSLIGMSLRKVNPQQVVLTLIKAKHGGLDVTVHNLETHYLAGGNISRVVDALIVAKSAGADLDWDTATAIDLADRDVLGAARLLQAGELGSDLPIDQLPQQRHHTGGPPVTER